MLFGEFLCDIKARERRKCDWWCAARRGQCHWQEANRVLAIQASCRREGTWALEAHASPAETCDTMSSALELLANLQEKQNFVEVAYDDKKETSRRTVVTPLKRFIEIDNDEALVSVKLRDQDLVVIDLLEPAFNSLDDKDAAVQ